MDYPENNNDYASRIHAAESESERVTLVATWVLRKFDAYYRESRNIPNLAQKAFEEQDPITSLALSKRRLSMYSESIDEFGPTLKRTFPLLAEYEPLWDDVETYYLNMIEGRYEADFAFAYLHSIRRKIYQGDWKPVEYSFSRSLEKVPGFKRKIHRTFPVEGGISPAIVVEILKIPAFSQPYRDLDEDAALIVERVQRELTRAREPALRLHAIEMVDAGFYRNRGAYLVGRLATNHDSDYVPFIIALLNSDQGIYVDAVLMSEADVHNLFSSTLANFHVTTDSYHELSEFLFSIMPRRPLGLHYSTVGFNHVGKVAVMNELKSELESSGEVLETAVGFRGTVTIGFSSPSSSYNLKVIRDAPTAGYKWGEYGGLDSVLRKYKRVHEINRTGSMLDNIIYYNLRLGKDMFEQTLLEELLSNARESVSLDRNFVIFKHLIVQRKVIPLPVFFETASGEDAETAVINLGYTIKNNAAANIFNKDLDARNYGVSRFLKIFLFDYDALEPLTEVKIRTNVDRIEGEEEIPEWYFEDGVVFLPEEIESGLMIPDRPLSRLFRDVHGDLLTTAYWEGLQTDLRLGKVPRLHVYPEGRRLKRPADPPGRIELQDRAVEGAKG